MRGEDRRSGGLFSYVDLEARVPADHPLRPIRAIVDDALNALSGEFAALYSHLGRPSIPPERLLRALLLQAFYSVRSERLLMEQLDYNLLFRWFIGLGIDDPVWHPTAFTTNRDRLLGGEVAAKFLAAVLDHARVRELLSREHFSIDGTLIEAWASMKSFRPKDGANEPPDGGRNGKPGLPRRAAAQRHPCLDHRWRGAAVPQGRGQGGQAQLHRPSVDGEPFGPGGRDAPDPGHRHGRTRSRQHPD
jgi:transposase